MPLRLSVDQYLEPYRGSVQEQDPFYSAVVARVTREVSEAASAAYSQAAGGSRVYSIVTGTNIDIKSEREEAERGPIDLKPGLLAGRSSKVSKKGVRYAVVPFRKTTPGRGKGGLYTLPRDVYRAVLRGQRIIPGTEMGERFRRLGYGGIEWTTGPYAGLTRYSAGGGGSRYYTFRTVTENSPAMSWIRPPFLQRQEAVQGVQDYMSGIIPDIINSYLGPPDFSSEEEEEEEYY